MHPSASSAPRASAELALAPASASGLPVHLTSFVGRASEVAVLRELLAQSRLLTLTGAGGCGKTRLALEVASRVAGENPGTVAWVELAGLSEPDLLPQQVSAVLGIREEAERPAEAALLDALRPRTFLLVLDNCEHLVDACAALADRLLRGCPGLKLLTTSREALGVAGERAWLVPPLSLPHTTAPEAPDQIAGCEAAQLFVARAQDVVPSFGLTAGNVAAVAQICRRLDGLPLAIELAAARVRVLAPEQIAARLDDAFGLLASGSRTSLPRHRTLRATIDWSYRLLSGAEQVLLQRLSVFVGGFTLDAAEAVCADPGLPSDDVLDVLGHLVDRSLVLVREQGGAARYNLLETIRQYAERRLQAAEAAPGAPGGRDVRYGFALYHVELAEHENERLHRPGQLQALARLDLENENLRAALAWSVTHGGGDLALRLCAALREFWRIRGHVSEGRRWMRDALASDAGADGLRARVLVGAADLARLQGDHPAVREEAGRAESMARSGGDRLALADALTTLGTDLVLQRDLAGAKARFDEAIQLWRELADGSGLVRALGGRASVAQAEGDFALARALREEAVQIARRADDRESEARGLLGLGELARQQDDWASARSCYQDSLALLRQLGDPFHLSVALNNLAWVAIADRRYDDALRLLAEGLELGASFGNQVSRPFGLATFAPVLHARGHPELAATALAAARHRLAEVGINPPPADAREWERVAERLRSALGEEAFERAGVEGRTASPADLLATIERTLGAGERGEVEAPSADAHRAAAAPAARSGVVVGVGAAPVPALRVLALGPLEIYSGGTLLPREVWRYARPRELLLMLLSHPEGRTKEQTGVVFWPDASGAQVKNSFHVTLHHLRRALGRSDAVVFENERYRINPALHHEFDAALFEARCRAELREARAGKGSPDRLQEVLALYRGHFLQDEVAGDWHLEQRDHLRRLWVDGLLALAGLLMEAGDHVEAVPVLQRIVVEDDLHEEAHRRLMLCLSRTGERIRALQHYDRLVQLLREELEAEPEEETAALYRRLKSGESL